MDLPDVGLPNTTIPGDITQQFQDFTLSFTGGAEIAIIIGIVCCVLGAVFMFYGARFFKYTLFAVTFLIGAALGYFIVLQIAPENSEAALITAVVLGLILGALTLKVWKVSLFLLGAGCGFVIWLTFKALFPDVLDTEFKMYGCLVVLILVLGLLAIKLEKTWLLIGTPLLGSFVLIQGVDTFVDEVHFNIFQLLNFAPCPNGADNSTMVINVTLPGNVTIPDYIEGGLGNKSTCGCTLTTCYVLYALVFVGWLLGLFVQYRYTSEYGQERRKKEGIKREARRDYEMQGGRR